MAETDLKDLYQTRILALAADIPFSERLKAPQKSVKRRSPLCGSMVTVDLVIKEGRITEFGQDVKACALGQAAASILGAKIIGRNYAEICKARDELQAMLTAGGPPPSPPFSEYEVLKPAQDFKNRHASIMLAVEATCAAMADALHAPIA